MKKIIKTFVHYYLTLDNTNILRLVGKQDSTEFSLPTFSL